MPAKKQPQDHKPKQSNVPAWRQFVGVDGETYTLPADAMKGLKKLTGREFREALEGGEAEARMGFRLLEGSEPDEGVLDALYDLPVPETVRIIGTWSQSAQGANGATLPQS